MSTLANTVSTDHCTLSWVCTAPFGRPVVPEVYMMNSGSSPSASTTHRVGDRTLTDAIRRS
jgi:hypothetical protein